MAKYLFRLDDIAPNMQWSRYWELIKLFDRYEVKPLLGVIPDNQDPDLLKFPDYEGDFWQHIREQQDNGYTIALHGHQHRFETEEPGLLGIHPRSEFAGLSYETQREKLMAGLAIFKENGIRTETFMAPAHSFDDNTLRAMQSVGLTTVTDGYSLRPYHEKGVLFVPQLFAYPKAVPLGVYTFCLHLNEMPDSRLEELQKFLHKQRQYVISFEEAVQMKGSALIQKTLGVGLRKLIEGKRLLASKK